MPEGPQVVDEKEMLAIYLQRRKQLQAERLFDAYNVNTQKVRKPQKSTDNAQSFAKRLSNNPYAQQL